MSTIHYPAPSFDGRERESTVMIKVRNETEDSLAISIPTSHLPHQSEVSQVSSEALDDFNEMNSLAARLVRLEDYFEKTETYHRFRTRVFSVLAQREARLREGRSELKGAVLIGPAGAGKSCIAAEIIREYNALTTQAGDWKFGTRILSVVVP